MTQQSRLAVKQLFLRKINVEESDKSSGGTSHLLDDLKKQFNDMFGASGSALSFMPMTNESHPADDEDAEKQEEDSKNFREKILGFSMRPRDIRDYLDRFVIKQQEAKKVLSVAVCDHFNHVKRCLSDEKFQDREYNKQNVLLLGPTGVGKTYLIRNIAKLLGVPFVKVDATKFSETGYAGADVDDMVRDLIKAANGNVDIAQFGIIFIDEVDKIAIAPGLSNGRDVSGRGVQINLLKLMEEGDVNVCGQADMIGQMRAMMALSSAKNRPSKINTRHILFIMSGAFDKLDEIIKTRIGAKSIGFNFGKSNFDSEYVWLQKAGTADFIKYGFEPEFIGRLPVRVACEELKADDLKSILVSSEGSILLQYKSDFAGYGINLTMSDDSLSDIAKSAAEEKTGARGLLTVLERFFRDFKFELPSVNVDELHVSSEVLRDPSVALEKILKNANTTK